MLWVWIDCSCDALGKPCGDFIFENDFKGVPRSEALNPAILTRAQVAILPDKMRFSRTFSLIAGRNTWYSATGW